MALGRKQDGAGLAISGGTNDYGRTPPPPEGQRYVRDPDVARKNAIRASVKAYKDSRLPVPPNLAAQAEGLGDEMQPEMKLEADGRPYDPFAPGNIPVPPLVPKPIDWNGQGHLDPPDQTEAPAASVAPATPPPGPMSARQAQPEVQKAAELTQLEAAITPQPPVQPDPAPVAQPVMKAGEQAPQPVVEPFATPAAPVAKAVPPAPTAEPKPVVEIVPEPAPQPAKPEPKPELKAAEHVVEATPEPEAAKPQTVAAARKAAAAKKAAPKAPQRK